MQIESERWESEKLNLSARNLNKLVSAFLLNNFLSHRSLFLSVEIYRQETLLHSSVYNLAQVLSFAQIFLNFSSNFVSSSRESSLLYELERERERNAEILFIHLSADVLS